MRKESIRITLAFVVFSFCIFGLACPAPQDQAVNNAVDVVKETADDAVDDPAVSVCEGDIQARVQKVQAHLDSKLSGMLQQGVFEVKAEAYMTENISVSFLGRIWGEDGSNTPSINKLNNALKKLAKSKCVTKVIFGEIPTPARDSGKTAESLTAPGFEWGLCEEPQQPCPDGCKIQCAIVTPTPTPNPAPEQKPATNAN